MTTSQRFPEILEQLAEETRWERKDEWETDGRSENGAEDRETVRE